jgi:type II secretory pathway pseudopilin PulG
MPRGESIAGFEVMAKNGFSLIEALLAIILVGVSIAALLAASGSFSQSNAAGTELSTAEFLLEQIRELAAMLPVVDPNTGTATFGAEEPNLAEYDDLDDFDGKSFSPPISADRQTLTDFAAFTQQITVENVSKSDFDQVVADHSSCFVRVGIKVFLNTREIVSANLVRANLVDCE